MANTVLPWELWGNVFMYLSDFRDWGRMERVCRGFQGEIRRGPWTKVQNLTVQLHCFLGSRYHIGVKKTKGAAEANQLVSFSEEMGVVRAVAERATNLKEMNISTSLFCFNEVEFEMCTDLIRALRFSASRVLCGLTWFVSDSEHVQFIPMLDDPMAHLINQFSDTLTDINIINLPFPLLSVSRAIGNCSSIKVLNLTDNTGSFGNYGSEEMVAMLRNKPALKALKLTVPNNECSFGVANGLFGSGSKLTELHLDCRIFGNLDLFLAHYWCSAQHLAQHPLMTVTNVSLSNFDSLDDSNTFLDAFPNLSKLSFPYERVLAFALTNFIVLIVTFLQKYHAMVGEPKKLHVEGEWRKFVEEKEVIIEQVQRHISSHSHFGQGQGKMQLTFQKGNAILEVIVETPHDGVVLW